MRVRWHSLLYFLLIGACAAKLGARAANTQAKRPPSSPPRPLQTQLPNGTRASLSSDDKLYKNVIAANKRAQAIVAKNWTRSPAHLCASAGVHGFVKKEAEPWRMKTAPQQLRFYNLARLPVYRFGSYFISREHKFIYVLQFKSSTQSMKTALRALLRGEAGTVRNHHRRVSFMRRVRADDITDEEWREFFVFTVVRNPWTRLASAYWFLRDRHLFLRKNTTEDAAPHTPCSIPFKNVTADSYSLISACRTRRCCTYVHELGRWHPTWVHYHITEQSQSVFTPYGRSRVDFIGRAEHLHEDWPVIANTINERVNSSLEVKAIGRVNSGSNTFSQTSGLPCNLGRYFSMYDDAQMRSVAMQYALDVVRFAFLGDPKQLQET